MFASRILDFILKNVGKHQFLCNFHSMDDFVQHQTTCVKNIPEHLMDFYIELVIRIECDDSKIHFRDMEYPTDAPSLITYFYFSKLYPNKLVLVGTMPPPIVKKQNAFFDTLAHLCEKNEIIAKSCPPGAEWNQLHSYGFNATTGNFDLVIPK